VDILLKLKKAKRFNEKYEVTIEIITRKNDNSINLVFTKKYGTYSRMNIIKYLFKIIHYEVRTVNFII